MGTPEFPNLGKHCTVDDCKLIDFLPFTCDRCQQVFCLEHRSYIKHSCPKANDNDLNVVICPLCAKGVHLNPEEDPNITWDRHVNTDCDPSNYDKVTKKKKCPTPGCKEILTFSNTIKCKDCLIDHCLKHRFASDHKCPGPKKKQDIAFPFISLLNRSRNEEPKKPNRAPATSSSSNWATNFLNAASSVKASAEAGMSKLSNELNQKWQVAKDGLGSSSYGGTEEVEVCPQCGAKFSSVTTLIDHVQKVHERKGNQAGVKKVTVDVCPKCSKGFRDPVDLVEHVERDHGGTSRA
ncbi:hypothetical protein ACFE04_000285 [Oxalis oulophora]